MPTQTFDLSILDHQSYPGYIPICLCFPLRQGQTQFTVSDHLQGTLTKLQAILPWLAGVIKRPSEPGGQYVLVLNPEDKIPLIVRNIEQQLPPYSELSSQRMPANVLQTGLVSNDEIFPIPKTEAASVFVVQANFLVGGLILTIYVHHKALDGTAMGTLIDIMARLYAGQEIPPTEIESFCPIELRQSMFKGRPGPGGMVSVNGHPQYLLIDKDSTPPAFHPSRSGDTTSKLVFFSDAKLAELKASCKPSNTESWISTNDALFALIWSSITRAKYPNHAAAVAVAKPTVLVTPINIRKRSSPPVSSSYLGNAFLDVLTPISTDVLISSPLSTIASVIRKSVAAVTGDYIDDNIALFRSVRDDQILMSGIRDLVLTSWVEQPAYTADFGPSLGKADWVRVPFSKAIVGILIVLPRRSDGIEVGLYAPSDEMEGLLADGEFMRWVDYVTD